jgi:hypothetical protein
MTGGNLIRLSLRHGKIFDAVKQFSLYNPFRAVQHTLPHNRSIANP